MKFNKSTSKNEPYTKGNENAPLDELANLKRITEIDNRVEKIFDDLVVSTPNESHINELAELWANLASVQQIYAPERYNFRAEGKDWRSFVRKKILKKNNLLLVTHNVGEPEVKGFLYLQTVTIPSSDFVLKGVVEDIYTKPQYRKQGIASAMFEAAFEWALKQNIKQIDLILLSKTKDLTEFYLKILKRNMKDVNLEILTI